LTNGGFSLRVAEKYGFIVGESAPIWGRYGGLQFGEGSTLGDYGVETLLRKGHQRTYFLNWIILGYGGKKIGMSLLSSNSFLTSNFGGI